MRKPIMIALAVLTMVACKKKSEDPKPVASVSAPVAQKPLYREMLPQQPTCEGGTAVVSFLRTENGQDVYTVKVTDPKNAVLETLTVRAWVSGGSYYGTGAEVRTDGSWTTPTVSRYVKCYLRW